MILEELCKASPDILNMHFDDPSAVSVAFSPRKNKRGESNIGVSHKDRSHWKNPYVKDGISVSGLVQAVGASDRKIVNITKPVYSNGRFVGLAVAALDLEQIAAQVLKGLAHGCLSNRHFRQKRRGYLFFRQVGSASQSLD